MQVLKAKPKAGHIAVAELAKRVERLTLITQNVDDLHERSGNTDVVHLHGSLYSPRCFACDRPYTIPDVIPDEPVGGRRLTPPHCKHCKGPIRLGVVWFGEILIVSKVSAYPLELFQRVITVSLETVKIVGALPKLEITGIDG